MSLTILVVDDASFVRDLVKRTVRKLLPQADIVEAHTGTRAQSVLRQRPVDLILSDWEMPEMSGEELLRWVRQEERTAATPFVMISSRGDRDHVVKAIQAGVNDYLTKPFTADELVRKLLKQLKHLGVDVAAANADAPSSPFGSADVLTGAAKRRPAKPRSVQAASQFAAPAASKPSAEREAFNGRASLRFAEGTAECEVRDITLQTMTGIISREIGLPALFESAAVDLESSNGETLARLNAYVHALQAVQADPESDQVKIVLRFVDKDPAKLEALSKFLTKR